LILDCQTLEAKKASGKLPPYKKLNLSFYEAANPSTFIDNPKFAWGFYGHRLNLYRKTTPHKGFYYLQEWIKALSLNYFIITSNVDGQFQKSGFDEEHIYMKFMDLSTISNVLYLAVKQFGKTMLNSYR